MTRGATGPGVVVHRDKQLLADAAAARLVTAVVDAQASRGSAHVVLTGGSMGSAILESLGRSTAREAIDWRQLDIWWGDERFLPRGDAERNETQARAALLDAVHLDPARVHPMPALDGPDGPDVDAAALSAPDTRNHTSRAAQRAGKVSEIRTGGGLGAPRTATVVAARSCSAGCSGKSEATWASGPTPSMRTSNWGTSSPRPAAAASSRA